MFRNNYSFAVPITLLLVLLLVCSCSTQKTNIGLADNQNEMIWPSSPDKPRIRYVGYISEPKDLGISQGWLQKLFTFAVGKQKNGMVLPIAVIDNGFNQLYVADPGINSVHRFDMKKGTYRSIKRTGNKDFKSPVSLTTDKNGNVYISDSELATIYSVGKDSNEAVPVLFERDFVRPTGIIIDKSSGWLYVVDTGIHKVSVFNAKQQLVKVFGNRGTGDGELNYPTYVWFNKKDQLLITDSLNFRIQLFNRFGDYISKFGTPGSTMGNLSRPKGIAVDSYGHIYVVDSLLHNVQLFSSSGELLMHFGSQGTNPGEFWLPVGIFINDSDMIYLCDSYNKRIQIFQYIGGEP